jgi:hypothetical protein
MGIAIDNPLSAGSLVPSVPYSAFPYSSTITPINNSNITVTCTGNLTINPPVNSTNGSMVRMWIVASGADRTVSLNGSIRIPRTSTFTSPQTILSGEKARLTIQYDANKSIWELITFVNGY